jgi:hypothetical protein
MASSNWTANAQPGVGRAGGGPLSSHGVNYQTIGAKPVTYVLRGWYAAGAHFETWTSVDTIATTPPGGHTLSGVCVVGSF